MELPHQAHIHPSMVKNFIYLFICIIHSIFYSIVLYCILLFMHCLWTSVCILSCRRVPPRTPLKGTRKAVTRISTLLSQNIIDCPPHSPDETRNSAEKVWNVHYHVRFCRCRQISLLSIFCYYGPVWEDAAGRLIGLLIGVTCNYIVYIY